VNCRQYYGESSEAHGKAYEGLAVSLGPGGDGTSIGSILTQPILTTGTETVDCPSFILGISLKGTYYVLFFPKSSFWFGGLLEQVFILES